MKRALKSERVLVDGIFQQGIVVVEKSKIVRVVCGVDAQSQFLRLNSDLLVHNLGKKYIFPGIVDCGFHKIVNDVGGKEGSVSDFERCSYLAAACGITTLIDTPLLPLPAALSMRLVESRVSKLKRAKLAVHVGVLAKLDLSNRLDQGSLRKISRQGVLGIVLDIHTLHARPKDLDSLIQNYTNKGGALVVQLNKSGIHIKPLDSDGKERTDKWMQRKVPQDKQPLCSEWTQEGEGDPLQRGIIELRRKYLLDALNSVFRSQIARETDRNISPRYIHSCEDDSLSSPTFGGGMGDKASDGRLFSTPPSSQSHSKKQPRSCQSCGAIGSSPRSVDSPLLDATRAARRQHRSASFNVRSWRLDQDESCANEEITDRPAIRRSLLRFKSASFDGQVDLDKEKENEITGFSVNRAVKLQQKAGSFIQRGTNFSNASLSTLKHQPRLSAFCVPKPRPLNNGHPRTKSQPTNAPIKLEGINALTPGALNTLKQVVNTLGPKGHDKVYFVSRYETDDGCEELKAVSYANRQINMAYRKHGTPQQTIQHAFTQSKSTSIPFSAILESMTRIPAKLLGLENKGTLAEGMDADIVVYDPDSEKVHMTICAGQIVFQ
eukprot:CAMPEP_0203751076 /NCGR_PEP_ID=MMETSP0098-20131031/5209_1 /ASSEMBLY_ACC=CAM_ASM_000208 /TAXON_ID=96639 /ORGANISM=" , Strain NY0313808BC1" /LENGTH=605 /DNA_ID=CAMNT_0050640641 /DNA_START=389 /DNA_END=2203 /DNA_ORIENTATION=+